MSSVVTDGVSTLRGLWQAARRQPWLLYGVPLVTALAAVIAVLLINKRYQTDISFIYESSNNLELPSAVMGIVSQLNLGRAKPSESPQFYAALIDSRPVLNSLLVMRPQHSCGSQGGTRLVDLLGVSGKNLEDSLSNGRRVLEKRVATEIDLRTAIVSVTVEAGCPHLAAELADSLVAALNDFNIRSRQSTAKTRRLFVEERVADAEASLREAENALESFLRRNRSFEQSPELSFQSTRLQRRVEHWQEMSTELRRQYESARIEEVNSTPVVTIIEPPAVPTRPSWPKRRMIVALAAFVGTILGSGFAIARTLTSPLSPDAPADLRGLHAWAGLAGETPDDRLTPVPPGRVA
jgi:uncharacterized protein involved in exopolysaccharide biosynthesis